MKKTTKVSIATTFIVFLCAYYGLGTFLLIKSDIHDLVRYSYNHDSGGYPLYPKGIAEFYLFKFRGHEDDLASLKSGKGLAIYWPFQMIMNQIRQFSICSSSKQRF
jgi:hypothetical protein